jgi:hypothetical protein
MKRKTQPQNVDTEGMSFDQVKQMAINNEPLVHKVKLVDINFSDEGVLSIEGQQVNSDDGLEKKLLKILGLQPAFVQRFGKLTGAEARKALIEMIKQATMLSSNKKQLITILGNPVTKSVFNMLPGERDFISNEFAMEQFEKIQQKYPYLQPHAMHVHKDGGFTLTLKTSDIVTPTDGQGNPIINPSGESENYVPGLSLINSPERGIYNNIFMWRLICSNGMEGLDIGDGNLKVNQLSSDQLQKFFDNVDKMAMTNFASSQYSENLQKAMSTKASFAEVSAARDIMLKNSTLTEANLGAFLPEFVTETRKLAAKGYTDYKKFTDAQLANYQTGATVWDVVNRITDFGSHDYGFKAQYNKIQAKAGQLFDKKTYDSENLILAGLNK